MWYSSGTMKVERVENDFAVKFAEHPYQPVLSEARVAIGALGLLPHETERLGIADPVEDPLVTALDQQMIKQEALYARHARSKPAGNDERGDFERHMTADELVLLRGALQLYYETTPLALQASSGERVQTGIRREGARIARDMKEVIDGQEIKLKPVALTLPAIEASSPGLYM